MKLDYLRETISIVLASYIRFSFIFIMFLFFLSLSCDLSPSTFSEKFVYYLCYRFKSRDNMHLQNFPGLTPNTAPYIERSTLTLFPSSNLFMNPNNPRNPSTTSKFHLSLHTPRSTSTTNPLRRPLQLCTWCLLRFPSLQRLLGISLLLSILAAFPSPKCKAGLLASALHSKLSCTAANRRWFG